MEINYSCFTEIPRILNDGKPNRKAARSRLKSLYILTKVIHVKRKMEVKMRASAETRRTWPK